MDFGAGWSLEDTLGAIAALGAIHADVQHTKDVISRGGRETNPIYGTPHPSGSALDQGELVAGALTVTTSAALSPRNRKIGLGMIAGFEAGMASLPENRRHFGDDLALPVLMGLAGAGLGALATKPDLSILPTKGGITLGAQWRF